jgi:ParB family chromosome partitioning protein
MKRGGLGKGLDKLIPDKKIAEPEKENKVEVKVEKQIEKVIVKENTGEPLNVKLALIEPNKDQPRSYFDEDALNSLADSIRENGIIEPLVLKKNGSRYIIIAGERRWRAARIAGLKEVPCVILDLTEQATFEAALIENIQRRDLNPIEEANAYKKLKEDYNLSHDEIATKVGKSRSAITNSLRLLGLKKEIQEMLIQEIITEGHGKVLAGIEDLDLQLEIANAIRDNSLSVRETEKLVNKRLNEKDSKKDKKEEINQDLENVYKEAENELKSIFSNKVVIKHNNKNKGKITIEYYNADDFERIMKIIKSGERK